ncbi:MAG: aminomethyl-transferring glycine dehydrogenase subunit GcvPB [Firmicutes bacterium]|nr:aminomethyl-transferring glycine dehydrogenase subunit GcvPB [Bacillota bacterium]
MIDGSSSTIFDLSQSGKRGYRLPDLDVPEQEITELIPAALLRKEPVPLPQVSEPEVVRHYTLLSRKNHAVDVGFYPLGSCTMKYNPKVNEDIASQGGFADLHPYQPEETVQGMLELIYQLEDMLCEISGLAACTLQPAAGAHGELAGLFLIKAYHRDRGEGEQRTQIIIPDSAHGTNPASAAMCGYEVVEIPSDNRGGMDLEALRRAVGPQTAGLMLTNPNTLGLFDENTREIAELVHQAGGLLYYDGANANAILGISRAGDMGFDIVHFNLHKTFSTPHGGGGPGAGPICVREDLVPYLPVPRVVKGEQGYALDYQRPKSIGKIKNFYGNIGVAIRAYAYILSQGAEGLRRVSEVAVLNANYLLAKLKEDFALPYDRFCKHEFVLSGSRQAAHGVRTLDLVKRLLDYGIHAPTVYFPLIVDEAMMIEPTETESKETLDHFIAVMKQIAREAQEDPNLLLEAPHSTLVRRLDETKAARQPDVRYQWQPQSQG